MCRSGAETASAAGTEDGAGAASSRGAPEQPAATATRAARDAAASARERAGALGKRRKTRDANSAACRGPNSWSGGGGAATQPLAPGLGRERRRRRRRDEIAEHAGEAFGVPVVGEVPR